ncbi:MAG TPA: DUF3738 domain-containing protein [Verrucomicrobiae bacterium]|nr:DUF3738 domain-containing protein [Verrucomicrobiae bacterium]
MFPSTVVDETGLTNRYDFDWDFGPGDRPTLGKMLAHPRWARNLKPFHWMFW